MLQGENDSKYKIHLTTSRKDWEKVRECYVESFRRYPLYKYIVPEESKRDEFLRAYLDANYEVTVGSGQGILIKLVVNVSTNDNDSEGLIAGGLLCVPPSSDGCGWAIGDDEPYWKAYEKYNLAVISDDGLKRLKRYEAWENKNISENFSKSGIAAWNGLFCAIAPKYTTKGIGSALYKETIKLIATHYVKKRRICCRKGDNAQVNLKNTPQILREKVVSRYSVPVEISQDDVCTQTINSSNNSCNVQQTNLKNNSRNIESVFQNSSAPLVVAISHSERAARFYEVNGFHPTVEIPFYDEVNKVTPFKVHVLVLDPFQTGNICKCKNMFNSVKSNFKGGQLTEVTKYH